MVNHVTKQIYTIETTSDEVAEKVSLFLKKIIDEATEAQKVATIINFEASKTYVTTEPKKILKD